MPAKRKNENKPQRLAKSLPADSPRERIRRPRKNPVRPLPRRDSGRTLANERDLPEFAWLVGALRAEKIRFQIIGMSAAILQGVPGSTQDIDLWLDLSPRQYMRAMNLACSLGGQFVRNTVVELRDGTLVNFVYEVTGLGKFAGRRGGPLARRRSR